MIKLTRLLLLLRGKAMPVLEGNAIVGQSGGPTAAINATLSGVIRGCCDAAKNGTIGTVYGMKNGIDGLINGKYIDLSYMWDDEDQLSLLENNKSKAEGKNFGHLFHFSVTIISQLYAWVRIYSITSVKVSPLRWIPSPLWALSGKTPFSSSIS